MTNESVIRKDFYEMFKKWQTAGAGNDTNQPSNSKITETASSASIQQQSGEEKKEEKNTYPRDDSSQNNRNNNNNNNHNNNAFSNFLNSLGMMNLMRNTNMPKNYKLDSNTHFFIKTG